MVVRACADHITGVDVRVQIVTALKCEEAINICAVIDQTTSRDAPSSSSSSRKKSIYGRTTNPPFLYVLVLNQTLLRMRVC